MTFTEKVRSMTAKEIIMAMVEGLKNPYTKIDMETYGERRGSICYGCAATNTICYIDGGIDNLLPDAGHRVYFDSIISQFETAINKLRQGNISGYNVWIEKAFIAEIKTIDGIELPYLGSDYTLAELEPYIALANAQ